MQAKWLAIWIAAALMAGCAASPQPFDYHDDREEKPGPGLFSGEKGGLVIHGPSDAAAAEGASIPDGQDVNTD